MEKSKDMNEYNKSAIFDKIWILDKQVSYISSNKISKQNRLAIKRQ